MRRKQVRKLGYSYQLVVKLDDEGAEARHVMSYGTIGRGRARERVDEVSEYATKKRATGQDRGDSTSLQRGCSRSGCREDSIHALSSPREMIARPKMSHVE